MRTKLRNLAISALMVLALLAMMPSAEASVQIPSCDFSDLVQADLGSGVASYAKNSIASVSLSSQKQQSVAMAQACGDDDDLWCNNGADCCNNTDDINADDPCYCDGSSGQYNEVRCNAHNQCNANPDGPLCTGERVICRDGTSTDWDQDGDGQCDKDDTDTDGDGVPNRCDEPDEDPIQNYEDWARYQVKGGC